MSPGWIDMAQRRIADVLAGKDLSGINYTLCEEFTNPPDHLRQGTAASLGFYIRVVDGRAEVGDHPIDDADCKIVSEYEDALPVARDPNAPAADPRLMQERLASGRLRIEGNPQEAPAILQNLNVHTLLASETA